MRRKPKSTSPKIDVATKVREYLRPKEAGKRGYEKSDLLLREIAEHVKPGEPIVLNESDRRATLIDRFAGEDIVWQPSTARRWELKLNRKMVLQKPRALGPRKPLRMHREMRAISSRQNQMFLMR